MPVEPNSATVSATADNTPVQLLLQQKDHEARLILTGTYTGLEGAIYGSKSPSSSPPAYNDASWLPLSAQQESIGETVSGTLDPGSQNLSYFIKCGGWRWLQFNPTAIGSGTAVMQLFSAPTLGGGAVPASSTSVGAGAPVNTLVPTSLGTTQNSTPTAAQLLGGKITQTGATGAGTVTLPTGTQMSSAFASTPAVGTEFECLFENLGGGETLTITGATGMTVEGTAAVGSGKNAFIKFICTGVNTWVADTLVSA